MTEREKSAPLLPQSGHRLAQAPDKTQDAADKQKDAQKPEGAPASAALSSDGGPASSDGARATKAGIADAPLAIIVSCKSGSELDAGLATQNMAVAAQLLGYGVKIVSSPTMALNGEKAESYRETLGVPADMSAVAVLLVGYVDATVDTTADGMTGPSTRDPFSDVVTMVAG